MKEWFLENTSVTESEYTSLINSKSVNINRQKCDYEECELSYHPMNTITAFTYQVPSYLRMLAFGIQKYEEYYVYEGISFKVLGEFSYIDVINKMKRCLYSYDRDNACFSMSIKICLGIEGSYILTLMNEDVSLKSEIHYIHSVVLVKDELNREYIMDASLNIFMRKDEYLQIFNSEVISQIWGEELKRDLTFIKDSGNLTNINAEEYLCFRSETMEVVKRLKL